jgi:hypothetical protein
MAFERIFDLDHIFAKEIEKTAWKIPFRAFDITDRAGSRDFDRFLIFNPVVASGGLQPDSVVLGVGRDGGTRDT